jgi:hypothetical protein
MKKVKEAIEGTSNVEVKSYLSIPTKIKGELVELKFNNPSRLVYSNVFQDLAKQNYYDAIDSIIMNCYIKSNDIDLVNNEPLKMSLTTELMRLFFTFKEVVINAVYLGEKYKELYKELLFKHKFVFHIRVGEDKEFFLKPLEKEDYKAIFNQVIKSPLGALNYIFNNLFLGGDDIMNDTPSFVSCFLIPDFLLKYKEEDIKKK